MSTNALLCLAAAMDGHAALAAALKIPAWETLTPEGQATALVEALLAQRERRRALYETLKTRADGLRAALATAQKDAATYRRMYESLSARAGSSLGNPFADLFGDGFLGLGRRR